MNNKNTFSKRKNLVFTLLITLAITACKPQLENLSITDQDGTPLTLVPAFDPDITEYALTDSYQHELIKLQATPSANTKTQDFFSNRFATKLVDTAPLGEEDEHDIYVAPGTNTLAVHLENTFGQATYQINVHKPYNQQSIIEELIDSTLTHYYEGDGAIGSQWNVGLSAAVYLPNGVTYSTFRGVNKWGTEEPITEANLFPVASMTKSFIAALGLQVVNEFDVYGLSMEDTVGDWLTEDDLPDPLYIPRDITFYQLLAHTSGLPRQAYTVESVLENILVNWTAEKWIKRRELYAYTSPDPLWSFTYADINYWLAGVILDRALKRVDPNNSTVKEIRKRFLAPLNLRDTYFAEENFPVHRLVRGHFHDTGSVLGGGIKRNPLQLLPFLNSTDKDIVRKASFAGGMVSTAADMARWHNALLHEQNTPYAAYGVDGPVSEIILKDISSPYYTGEDAIYRAQPGFGVVNYNLYGFDHRVLATRGDLALYSGQMAYEIETGAVIVILENRGYELGGESQQRRIGSKLLEALAPYMGERSNQ